MPHLVDAWEAPAADDFNAEALPNRYEADESLKASEGEGFGGSLCKQTRKQSFLELV